MTGRLLGRAVTVTVLTAMELGQAGAAEKIRWADLRGCLGPSVEYRSVNVIARDGQKFHAQRLEFRAGQLALYDRDNLAYALLGEDVARVEIRQRKRWYRHIVGNILGSLTLPGESETALSLALSAVVAPPILVYGIASAPVFLAADGIAFLMPAKRFEIVP